MPSRPVDFTGAIVADLPRGRIETRDRRRHAALPVEWIDTLVAKVGADAAAALGSSLANAIEADARTALGDDANAAPEDVAFALSAALATRGLGTVEFERWGDALVVQWIDPPGHGPAWSEIAAGVFGTLIGKLMGLKVEAAPFATTADETQLLLGSHEVCQLVRERAKAGESLAQILGRIERGAEVRS